MSDVDASQQEGDSDATPLTFTVNLSKASDQTTSVDFTTTNGSAVAESDFVATNGTLTFEPGETRQTITIDVINDRRLEVEETFSFILSNAVNADLRERPGIGTITDNDSLQLSNAIVDENSTTDTVIGVFSATDADDPDPFTFNLIEDGNGRFKIEGNRLQVADGSRLDFESIQSHDVTVQAIDTAGNQFEETFTVEVRNIIEGDLIIDAVTISPTEITSDESLNISWTVRNQGTEITSSSWSDRIYLSIDETLSADDISLEVLSTPNAQLSLNETYSQTTSVSLPNELSDGTYYILVKADDSENQEETEENNNIGTASFSIRNPTPTPEIDLVVDTVTISPTEITSGESLDVSWTVRNQGTGTTIESWSDRIYLSTDESLSNEDISLDVLSIQDIQLSPNETYSQTASVDLPDELSDGTYYVLIETDDANIQEEINEINNLGTVDFTVTNESVEEVEGLEVQILSSSTIRSDQQGVVTVVYTNTGDTDIVAPLLQIDADNASLKAFGEDEFTEDPIQKLGINSNGSAGILTPGASGRFSFTFDPLTEAGTEINFSVSTVTDNTPIDWNEIRDEAQPSYLNDEAWDRIWNNFVDEVGTTTDSYAATLAENATYLGQIGETTDDVERLLGFELQQASDYQALSQRYSLGSFGRGRFFIGDIQAITDETGNVTIENSGTQRSFTLQEDGSYRSSLGDYGTLTLDGGVYKLAEQGGTVTVFRPDGRLDFIEDTNSNRLTTQYNGSQLTGLNASNGDSLTLTRNESDRITRVTDSVGRVTTYNYDETGELLLNVTSVEGTTNYTYDDNFALTSITDQNGTQATFEYDNRGRLIRGSFNDGAEEITYSYGENGEVTVTDASGETTQLLLNDRGQVSQLEDALGRTLRINYDEAGNPTEITAPDDSALSFTYDNEGNLLTQVNSLGQRTGFTYEPNFDLLESVTDPRGNAINYDYDESGNLLSITYADNSRETFGYDEEGNFTQSINRRSQSITYNYNQRSQLLRQDNTDGSFYEYTYDEQGNLTSATDSNGTITLEYDNGDRLTKITYANGRSLAYTYDAGGRRTSMTDQDGNTVNYSYDNAGRLAGLTDGNSDLIIAYTYDEVGRLIQEENGNGTYTTYTYDSAGQLTNITNFAPNDSINSRYDYSYDELGQQIGVVTLDGEWTYDYDAIGQLTGAVFASTNPEIPDQDLTYIYDAAGNRIRTIVNGETTEYTANNLNQYERAGDVIYDYDTDGNLISKTESDRIWTYEYNNENRLVKVIEPDGVATEYKYDALGNRIATVYNGEQTEYLIDPFGLGDVVGEYDNAGNLVANYTHGIGIVNRSDSSGSAYYDSNAIGSTVGLTNAVGSQVNRYSYLPFGQELSEAETISNPFEFVGQWGVMEDENGLDFMRARFYDSLIGNFLSPDPIGIAAGDTNFSRYTFNNPISYTDPSGNLFFIPILVAAGIGAATGAATDVVIQVGANTVDYYVNGGNRGDILDIDWGNVGISALLGTVGGGATSALKNTTKISSQIGKQFSHGIPSRVTRPSSPSYNRFVPKWLTDQSHPLGRLNGEYISPRLHYKIDRYGGYGGLIGGGFVAAGTHAGISKFPNWLQRILRFPSWLRNSALGGFVGNSYGEEIAELLTDIIDSLNEIISPPDNQSRSKGEPHLTTFDGVGYSFQGAGEFTLVESLDDDLNIQIRYVEIDSRATVASAVATIVDGRRVVIDSEGIQFVEGRPIVTRSTSGGTAKITVDGEVVEVPENGELDIGSSKIYRQDGEKYTIVYAGEDGVVNDGDDQLVVDYMRPGTINIVDVFLGDEKKGQIQGLLGNLNDNPDDDVALPDGTPLDRPLRFSELYGEYREAWRISDPAASLFNYETGQGPDTFYNPNFPVTSISFNDLSAEAQARGTEAALAAGYEPGTFEFNSAAFDFAITDDPGFLDGSETDPEVNEALSIINDQKESGTAFTNLIGAELQLQYFFPNLDTSARETIVATVGDGTEFSQASSDSDTSVDEFEVGYTIDITENSIIFEVGEAFVDNPQFPDAEFNGIVFTDILNIIPAIQDITIDEFVTTLGVDISDITFTDDTVSINFAGLPYIPGDTVKLDLSFVGSSDGEENPSVDPIPTPIPTPTPDSTPDPIPTPDPDPTTAPNPTPTPEPSNPTPSPAPNPTPTPEPSNPTPSPAPNPTPTPEPSNPTPSPAPNLTPTPEPTPDVTSDPETSLDPEPELELLQPQPELLPTPPNLPNALTLSGTTGDDIQLGSSDSEIIRGFEGNDIQFGLSSDDNLYGNEDNDIILGNQNNDYIEGGTGDDWIFGGQDNDTLRGQAGNDYLFGDRDEDWLYGETDNDRLFGNQNDDQLRGGDGNDSLYGGRDNDTLEGEAGNDFVSGDLGDDVLFGADPNQVDAGIDEIDTLVGGSGNDIFVLGDEFQVYYEDNDSTTLGINDYALVIDFNTTQDTIQLKGSSLEYRLDTQPNNLPAGTAVYRSVSGEDELIAIIAEAPVLNLESDYFVFI